MTKLGRRAPAKRRHAWQLAGRGLGVMGILVWLGVAALSAGASAPESAATASPVPVDQVPVLAYYYIWFDPASWERAKTDLPLLGSYTSDNREVMRQHVRWAKAAGIDGFIVSWKDTEVLSRRLDLLVEVAWEEGFKLAIIYQGLDVKREPIGSDRIAADLDRFRDRYAGEEVFDLFDRPLVILSGTWEYTREQIADITTSRRDDLLILGSERNAGAYQHIADLVDGNAYYWSSVNPATYPGYPEKLQEMGELIHAHHGLWIAPAAPGFDARLIGGERVVERFDGSMLEEQLRAALSSDPDAIGLISWNEFSENSHVEPSCTYGGRALEVLASHRLRTPPTVDEQCDMAAFSAIQKLAQGKTESLSEPPPSEAEQGAADIDSSSPGDTSASPYSLIILGALGGVTATSLVMLVRRARMQAGSPAHLTEE